MRVVDAPSTGKAGGFALARTIGDFSRLKRLDTAVSAHRYNVDVSFVRYGSSNGLMGDALRPGTISYLRLASICSMAGQLGENRITKHEGIWLEVMIWDHLEERTPEAI